MLARIGVLRALNGNVERVFHTSRTETQGQTEAKTAVHEATHCEEHQATM
jgi:hypothetical protein